MAITPKFTRQMIKAELEAARQRIEKGLVDILNQVGLTFVRDARNMSKAKGGFGDDTGNLRSSIGYFILKNGVIISDNFEQFREGTEGKIMAERLLNDVKSKSGYQLVGVAGMEYASHVESKGYNVITAQADVAIISLDRILIKYAARMNALGVSVSFDTSGSVITAFA